MPVRAIRPGRDRGSAAAGRRLGSASTRSLRPARAASSISRVSSSSSTARVAVVHRGQLRRVRLLQQRADAQQPLGELVLDRPATGDPTQVDAELFELIGDGARVVAVEQQQRQHRLDAGPGAVAAPVRDDALGRDQHGLDDQVLDRDRSLGHQAGREATALPAARVRPAARRRAGASRVAHHALGGEAGEREQRFEHDGQRAGDLGRIGLRVRANGTSARSRRASTAQVSPESWSRTAVASSRSWRASWATVPGRCSSPR